MNRQQHIKLGLIGFIFYIVATYCLKPFEINDASIIILIVGGTTSVLGSVLPDLVEPGGDFRHRGFAHSKRVLSWCLAIFLILFIASLLAPVLLVLSAGLLGYILHLLADATTKTSIPE
ncbi:MAG: hypothetical protein ACPLZ8_07390 [Fervidicoccaceae archaeon]